MIYRLKELKGDTIAVPQLVFSKLGIAEEYNVRVALYVLATGITDPDKICADLKLRSRISAESALAFPCRRLCSGYACTGGVCPAGHSAFCL